MWNTAFFPSQWAAIRQTTISKSIKYALRSHLHPPPRCTLFHFFCVGTRGCVGNELRARAAYSELLCLNKSFSSPSSIEPIHSFTLMMPATLSVFSLLSSNNKHSPLWRLIRIYFALQTVRVLIAHSGFSRPGEREMAQPTRIMDRRGFLFWLRKKRLGLPKFMLRPCHPNELVAVLITFCSGMLQPCCFSCVLYT